ncbi:MAG: NAD(P)/FAD-dependent oxidoreductase [Aigarchaeota archaeon]|nr:NAD(P)/FAD-dependent oxidoreductase [Aigarchaeota archaeon]MDW8092305.1 NAD(P)/FAD-dependent oxidoreductase [Nitrososphaerota archaeon]
MSSLEFDGVIIGAGHNALVLAGYMAKSGLKVALIERNVTIGGGCGTYMHPEYPGFLHELHSQFHRNIPNLPWYRDLELSNYGLDYIYPQANNGTPLSSGKNIVVHANPDVSYKSIERISKKDADSYYKVYHKYQEMGRKIWFVRDYSPPLPPDEEARLLEKSEMGREFLQINKRSAYDIVMDLFESVEMRTFYLFLYSIRGYLPSPESKNTGFAAVAMTYLGNKAMLPRGGSRMLTNALSKVVLTHGGMIFENHEVSRIITKNGTAIGVETTNGRKFMAKKFVVSSVDPTQTFLRFIDDGHLGSDFLKKVRNYKYGASARSFGVLFTLHAGIHQPPRYASEKWDPMINEVFNTCIGYETPESIIKHIHETMEGIVPSEIGLQCAVPTLFDPTRAPKGKHVLLAWQFAPYHIKGHGPEKWDEIKYSYLEKVLDRWADYAPNLRKSSGNIIYMFPQTPPDTERHLINMREGDFHVGALIPEQLVYNRPFPEVSNYRTPIKNLYLTGAPTHPTGNITGAPGYNTARVIAQDLGINLWWNPPDPRREWASLE